jgi:hypothetical protein
MGTLLAGMAFEAYGPAWTLYEESRKARGLTPGAAFTSIGWNGSKYCAQRQRRCGEEVTGVTMVSPFPLSSSAPWEVKSDLAQWHELMDRTIANFGGPDGTWTEVQVEDAKEFWTAHCTTELVRMAAMVCLQPSATSMNARSSKTSLITLLVAAEVQCCSPYILEKLYASMGSGLQASAAGGASAGEGASQVRQSSPTPVCTPARIADVGTPQKACTSPEAPKPAEQPGSAESAILAALLKYTSIGWDGPVQVLRTAAGSVRRGSYVRNDGVSVPPDLLDTLGGVAYCQAQPWCSVLSMWGLHRRHARVIQWHSLVDRSATVQCSLREYGGSGADYILSCMLLADDLYMV